MILYFFIMTILYLPTKVILFFIVNKFGKFSYDDFSAAGFAYDSNKKVFYTTKNAWQKEFGYCHTYDVGAPFFQMIIDTEPIKFFYNNKNWLITFWKGQYGITTGAEIGIYSTTQKKVNKKTIYYPINDDELLNMSFTLYRKNEEITTISDKHWWLAIFKIGLFSKPKNLSMDIKIRFPNKDMLNAFLKSFKKLNHKTKYYNVIDNTFYFTFKKPKTRKVWTRTWLSDFIRQRINRKNVDLYNKYLEDVFDDNNSSKKQIKISQYIPDIIKNNSNDKNIIFLNKNVYSNINEIKNE